MRKNFDYRKYYAEYYGIEIPDGFDIHHIDGDRENNNIDNLIMLPSKLHHKYHMTRKFAENFDTTISFERCLSCEPKMAKQFYEVFIEIGKWFIEKSNMESNNKNNVPNVI